MCASNLFLTSQHGFATISLMLNGMTDSFFRLYRWFKRPKTTIFIILALLVIYFLGLVIPQKAFFQSRAQYEAWKGSVPFLFSFIDIIGFTDIFLSPVTLFLLAIFFLNLVAVTADRIPIILRRAYISEDSIPVFGPGDLKDSGRTRKIDISPGPAASAIEEISGYFRGKGWFVRDGREARTLLAVKNRFTVFGFLIFHLSFFVLLAGGLLIFYTRFSGNIVLTEGESFDGDMKQFRQISRQPKIMHALPSLLFSLEKVKMTYEGGLPSELSVAIRLRYEGEERNEVIGINRPVKMGGMTMLATNVGVSPLFILRNAGDRKEIDGAWVSLNVLKGKEDSFSFENNPETVFHARFFPDYVLEDGKEKTRSPEILNPAFHITVKKNKISIAEATIRPGQAMVFEPYMLELADLRHWAEFQMVREIGPAPLIAGFALAITGLVLRLIFYRREVRVAVEGGTVYVAGKSDLYQDSFEEEMDSLVEELKRGLTIKGE